MINEGRLISEGTGNQMRTAWAARLSTWTCPKLAEEATLAALGADQGAAGSITLPAPEGPASLVAAVRTLDAAGITPTDIRLRARPWTTRSSR